MSAPTDRAAWEAVLSGDASAFGAVWECHHARVERHLARLGAPSAEVEDLAAMTFLELWRRRDNVRFVDDSLLPWLLVTAGNVHRNNARARRRFRAFLDRLPAPESAPMASDTDIPSPEIVALRQTLAAARPADRHLMALTAVEGYTVAEAAKALSISESAATMRLSRLRKQIRGAVAAPHEKDSRPVPQGARS
jgi:RNA polymerase sigma-70 factor (ECF subfamily)